jgi:hypothetical protein
MKKFRITMAPYLVAKSYIVLDEIPVFKEIPFSEVIGTCAILNKHGVFYGDVTLNQDVHTDWYIYYNNRLVDGVEYSPSGITLSEKMIPERLTATVGEKLILI